MSNGTKDRVISLSALAPELFDEMTFAYTGSNLTTVNYLWKSTIVVTLTLEYSGSQLTRVYKSGP